MSIKNLAGVTHASVNKKRYFRVSYAFNGGTGATNVVSNGMFGMREFQEMVESRRTVSRCNADKSYFIENVVVMGWTEFSNKADYDAFMKNSE